MPALSQYRANFRSETSSHACLTLFVTSKMLGSCSSDIPFKPVFFFSCFARRITFFEYIGYVAKKNPSIAQLESCYDPHIHGLINRSTVRQKGKHCNLAIGVPQICAMRPAVIHDQCNFIGSMTSNEQNEAGRKPVLERDFIVPSVPFETYTELGGLRLKQSVVQ